MTFDSTLHRTRCFVLVFALLVMAGTLVSAAPPPSRLTDEQFWKLATELSEDDGSFRSDNLLSNETTFQYVIPDMLRTAKQGRVYLGVGPEQNFTYIAELNLFIVLFVNNSYGKIFVILNI